MSAENMSLNKIDRAAAGFAAEGRLLQKQPFGNGHINDTFLLTYEAPGGTEKKYILQRMNHTVFPNPIRLMENIVNVTEYLQDRIASSGGNPERETLNVVKTKSGAPCFEDECHDFWRMFLYIENTLCLEKVESAEDFRDSGRAFGGFQRMLADYPAQKLYETIPGFHNTPARFGAFEKAVAQDKLGRASSCREEIAFAFSRKEKTSVLTNLLGEGKLPLRVTHNDTKLNNILFDKETKKALCVIDLDTVMPGLSLYDFGDAIRFGASAGAEDEKDLTKVALDLTLFEAFCAGYLEGCGGSLTPKEVEMLPMGAWMMTFECGIRFLADYLEGDVYYKIHRPEHNLDRARTQFKLAADMEAKWKEMEKIIGKYKNSL